jgi:hypothetical protein
MDQQSNRIGRRGEDLALGQATYMNGFCVLTRPMYHRTGRDPSSGYGHLSDTVLWILALMVWYRIKESRACRDQDYKRRSATDTLEGESGQTSPDQRRELLRSYKHHPTRTHCGAAASG